MPRARKRACALPGPRASQRNGWPPNGAWRRSCVSNDAAASGPGRGCGRDAADPLVGVPGDESAALELVEPAPHRPGSPTTRIDLRVSEDVVEVLDGRSRDRVVLVVGASVARPPEAESRSAHDLAEVGVLAAVADVLLAEPSGAGPGRSGECERQRPEELGSRTLSDLAPAQPW